MKRESESSKFPIGSILPKFSLKATDGKIVSSESINIEKGLLIVFTCNHCPYVKGSEDALIKLTERYSKEGLSVFTINSNDPIKYPDDNFEKMKEKSEVMELPYAYLFDETQNAARLFDAACTPECFLFSKDRKLVFHGAINDNPMNPGGVKERYLQVAIEDLLAGKSIRLPYAHPVGCSIKWS
ncbi:MAG: thioredoxin family protein [bacterium]|nr:thioredoxin family protein [bacterium]